MYIPYEKIGNLLYKVFKNEGLKSYFYNKKIAQNIKFIERNKPKVLKKLKEKLENNETIKVVFYVYDETKWKCQPLYDMYASDSRFEVQILVTKSAAQNADNPTYQSVLDVVRTYNFFKEKSMKVELAYDIKNQKYIPFKEFKPDIIFYQHPWYVERTQGPVVCSEFAYTAYVPYYFPLEVGNIDNKIDYYLRFHKYVERYYAFDEAIEKKCKANMDNGGKNVKAVGYPHLDYFINNLKNDGEYIIYAPHWTVGGAGLAYSSFDWNGKFLLEYAKNHPETKWVFKPHPLLRKALADNKIMTDEEIDKYYRDWETVGIKYEGGDYLEWFNRSKMMVTDSCTFLGEYFVTEKPLILLMSETSPFKSLEHPILETYYCARNTDELKTLLETVLQNDYMKEKRLSALNRMGLKNCNASRNIFNDILEQIKG